VAFRHPAVPLATLLCPSGTTSLLSLSRMEVQPTLQSLLRFTSIMVYIVSRLTEHSTLLQPQGGTHVCRD
jgi:hypothetical protein